MKDCLFCRIVAGDEPARMVYQDDEFVAFHDKYPKAKVHVLVVPREHLDKLSDYPDSDEGERKLGRLFRVVNRVATKVLGLEHYKVLVHVGEKGGQEIFHIHVHIMSNAV